mgnify:CR=1 FL=1|tara:strand:+ start:336 stop:791 length:456 start_codon:yes stop_codon:yes gene_type:complete
MAQRNGLDSTYGGTQSDLAKQFPNLFAGNNNAAIAGGTSAIGGLAAAAQVIPVVGQVVAVIGAVVAIGLSVQEADQQRQLLAFSIRKKDQMEAMQQELDVIHVENQLILGLIQSELDAANEAQASIKTTQIITGTLLLISSLAFVYSINRK